MALVFKILCGFLYAIGMCFGLTYKEISVDLCIYACPAICVLCAAVSVIMGSNRTFFRRALLSLDISLLLFYIYTAKTFWHHYGEVYDPFALCVKDLQAVASKLNMTYEEVNIYLYCYLFFAIILFHLSQPLLLRTKRNRVGGTPTVEATTQTISKEKGNTDDTVA